MTQRRKRIWLLLAASLLFAQLGITACGKNTTENTEGLCEHHPTHTAECGSCRYVCEVCSGQSVQGSGMGESARESDLSVLNETNRSYYSRDEETTNNYDPRDKETTSIYDPRDIEAINAIIDDNGLSATKNDPASWDFARWDTSSTMKRINHLGLSSKSLAGHLDVSALSGLQVLYCYGNQLETLNVSGTPLTELHCYSNQLTGITGVSALSGLQMLKCAENQLKTLDVSGTALTYLDCSVNPLTEITGLSDLSALQTLRCFMNQLKTLDVSGLTALTELSCYKNQLTEITGISDLSKLQLLYCYENQLKTLDVSGLTALTELSCYYNQLETLDVSGLTELTTLAFTDNPCRSFKTSSGELTVSAVKGGTVAITAFFDAYNTVGLTAIPDINCLFRSWKGLPVGASNTASTKFPLTGNINVSVAFDSPDQRGDSHNLVGEFVDDNGDVNLIIKPEGDQYHVEIGIFRLTSLNDGIGKPDGKKIIFAATDASGSPISGEIIETAEGADVIFTNSTWGYIHNDDRFSYYR